ncbi:TonB-dependent receptor plug domain-containing protein [Pseudoduganella namucuonensis]|uniref:TonB-dependent receptor plug domain-containing protein n=1 Tax=Pseudoduganella namucuonensis TaxID=1035707 RepID=UPI001E295702|nr:TonB-dependent receptor plug domain-containing protein [Pseudoduganella namucuonensis]
MLTALCLACAGARGADQEDAVFELSLEQLRQVKVLTATKTATPLYATPAVVTLITADDFARYGYLSLAEALAHKAGFVESDDGLNHHFGVRGLNAGAQSASRGIKILLDGRPIAFRGTQQQFIGLEFIPVGMIERVEIVRGPVSVLYGADALLGAINVITRRDGAGQRVVVGYERGGGGRDSALLSGSGALRSGPYWLAWGVQAARADRAGLALPRVSPDYQRYGRAPSSPVDDADPRSLYLRGGWRDGDDELGGSVFWQKQDGDHVFASPNPLLRPPTHVALRQGTAHVNYSRAFGARHSVRAALGYGEGGPASGDLVRTGAPDYHLLRDLGYRAIDGSAEWLWQPEAGGSLLLGLDVLRDRETLESFRRHNVADGTDFQLSQPGEKTLRNTGVYVQWQFPLPWRLRGIAAGRGDRHSVYGRQQSYRAGVVGALPGAWQLKLLGGTAFQAPSTSLLYRTAVQPGDIRGNPALAPQKSRTVELQLASPPSAHWSAALTLYHTRVRDLVTLEQEFFNLVARNSSDSTVRGAELEARYRRDWFNAYLNASRANSARGVNRYTLAPLAQRPEGELFPRDSANLGASATLLDQRLVLSVDNRYVGPRPAATANVLLANQRYTLRGYVDTTLTARWALGGHAHVRLQVRDLANGRHVDPGVGGIDYPSPGRRYGVQYEYRF